MERKFRFSVEADDIVVGTVEIDHLDHGLKVASGPFKPSPQYAPRAHATTIDGVDCTAENMPSLALFDPNGIYLDCDMVSLQDWSATMGDDGRELTIFGFHDKVTHENS